MGQGTPTVEIGMSPAGGGGGLRETTKNDQSARFQLNIVKAQIEAPKSARVETAGRETAGPYPPGLKPVRGCNLSGAVLFGDRLISHRRN